MAYIHQRGNVWWIKYYKDGKQVQHSLKTEDKKVAQHHQNRIENTLLEGGSPLINSHASIVDAYATFEKNRIMQVTPKTRQNIKSQLFSFVSAYNLRSCGQINELTLQEYLNNLVAQGLMKTSANVIIKNIKCFMAFCAKHKIINDNHIRYMKPYKVDDDEKDPPRFLSDIEMDILLRAAKNFESPCQKYSKVKVGARETVKGRLVPLIIGAYYTGMRRSELKRLNIWEDIDFDIDRIFVKPGKNGKSRYIKLHPDFKKYLLTVFPKQQIYLCTVRVWDEAFRNIVEASGLPHLTFHDLRHTCASSLIRHGATLNEVKEILGHSSIKTTMIYIHCFEEQKENAVDRLPTHV